MHDAAVVVTTLVDDVSLQHCALTAVSVEVVVAWVERLDKRLEASRAVRIVAVYVTIVAERVAIAAVPSQPRQEAGAAEVGHVEVVHTKRRKETSLAALWLFFWLFC